MFCLLCHWEKNIKIGVPHENEIKSKISGHLGCDLDNAGESKIGKSRTIKIRKRIMAVMISLQGKTRWKEFGR